MSGLHLRFSTRAAAAATICPATVAMAAPATSIRGRPNQPKIRMGSSTMLMRAPVSWVHMARKVRPVDCRRRSKQNWPKMPMEQPRQMEA